MQPLPLLRMIPQAGRFDSDESPWEVCGWDPSSGTIGHADNGRPLRGWWWHVSIRNNRTGEVVLGLVEHGPFHSKAMRDLDAHKWWSEGAACDLDMELDAFRRMKEERA